MHSPPHPDTVKGQQDWKIPPRNSIWEMIPKGYTIPLDKRLAVDGRGLQDDDFANLSEALNVAVQKAREGLAMRLKAQEELMLKERERKVQELRSLAQKARSERTGVAPAPAAAPAPVLVPVDDIDRQVETDRFIKPYDDAFTGARKKQSGSSSKRERPDEFDNAEEESYTFGLDHFLIEVKRGRVGVKNLEDHALH